MQGFRKGHLQVTADSITPHTTGKRKLIAKYRTQVTSEEESSSKKEHVCNHKCLSDCSVEFLGLAY